MSILWYPTPKQSPLLGSLGLGGGIGANVIRSAAGGGTVDTSAAETLVEQSHRTLPVHGIYLTSSGGLVDPHLHIDLVL